MRVFICLGNPGKKYQKTRHNAGKMFGNFITSKWEAGSKKSKAGEIKNLGDGWKVVFLNCFMNESGLFVEKVLKIRKLRIENLIVVHDDLDIPFGEFKIQFGRGAAGHKGVQSIIDALQTRDFWRIRLGIRNPQVEKTVGPENFVLMPFTKEEEGKIRGIFEKVLSKLSPLLKVPLSL